MAKDFISDEEMAALDKSNKPKDFISDEEMKSLESSDDGGMGPIETAAKSALDAASMGYGPNIIAGIKTLGGTIGDYAKERDKERADLSLGQYENPISSAVGTGTGVVGQIGATALAPEIEGPALLAKFAESAPLISKIAKAFAIGEGMSAVKNPGDREGQVSGLQIEDRANNMLKDAPLNAAFAGVGGVISNKLDKLAQNKSLETMKVLSPTSSAIKDAESRFRTEDIANFMDRNGITQGFPDAKELAQRAAAAKDRAGKVIGGIFQKYSPELEKKIPNALDTYDQDNLLKVLSTNREGEGDAAQAVAGKVQAIIDDIKANKGDIPNFTLDDLHRIKQRVQDQVRNWKTALAVDKNAGPMVDMYQDASKYFDEMMADKLNQLDGKLGSELRIANRNYSLASDVDRMAQDNYYKSEAASAGSNLLTDIVNNVISPFKGKMPPAISTPNMNAKLANMPSQALQNPVMTALPAAWQGVQTPPVLPPRAPLLNKQGETAVRYNPNIPLTQRAQIINQNRKIIKRQLGQ